MKLWIFAFLAADSTSSKLTIRVQSPHLESRQKKGNHAILFSSTIIYVSKISEMLNHGMYNY